MTNQEAVSLKGYPPPHEIIVQLSRAISALKRVVPEKKDRCSGYTEPSTAESHSAISISRVNIREVEAVFAEVVRARTILTHVKFEHSPDIRAMLSEYQQLLQLFKNELPRLRGWLLAERARLAGRCAHSTAVGSWISANQQTR